MIACDIRIVGKDLGSGNQEAKGLGRKWEAVDKKSGSWHLNGFKLGSPPFFTA